MTTTSGLPGPGHRTAAVATTLIEAPEPIIEPITEPIGVDDPGIAHGGRPRRMPGPPVPGGLVQRVRPLGVPPTKVRRIPGGGNGIVDAA